MQYGEGFLQQGVEVRVIGKRARNGGYGPLVGTIVTITGAASGDGRMHVTRHKNNEGKWWVYCDDVEPIHVDNENYLNLLEEVDEDERDLPRIL